MTGGKHHPQTASMQSRNHRQFGFTPDETIGCVRLTLGELMLHIDNIAAMDP
jgi:hypothetical protein